MFKKLVQIYKGNVVLTLYCIYLGKVENFSNGLYKYLPSTPGTDTAMFLTIILSLFCTTDHNKYFDF